MTPTNKLRTKDRYSAAVTDVMDALKETSTASPPQMQDLLKGSWDLVTRVTR